MTSILDKNKDRLSLSLVSLAIPMILEQIFRIFVTSADTFMLSAYSQKAVAAVGLVNQYVFFIQILISMVCIGSSIVLTQYLGANKEKESDFVVQASIILVICSAIFLTIVIIFVSRPLLSSYTLEKEVFDFACIYILIVGGIGTIWTAFSLLQASVLRAYGLTKEVMIATLAANIVNVIGNGFAIYGWFGFPKIGVVGVAFSTVISQIVCCIILQIVIRKRKEIKFVIKNIRSIPFNVYKKILSVGVPVAGESLSYNASQIVIMSLITLLGTSVMSSHVYFQTISRFTYVFTIALGSAVQIKIGYFVGAKKQDIAYKRYFVYQLWGTFLSLLLVLIMNFVKTPIISIFTKDSETIYLVSKLLVVSFLLETGRSLNLIAVSALKGAGDVKFPVFFSLCSVWTISVFGSWLLGIHFGFGLIGIWISIGSEECVRGICMIFRWKSKRWQTKAIA